MGKPEITRRNIIQASVKLAKENGPSNVTVREICEEAGISKNTFYLYFHNRDEVFGETYYSDDDEKQTRFPQIMLEYDSPLEQFWELLKIDIQRHIDFGPKLLATISMQNVSQIAFFSEDPELQPETVKVFTSLVGKMQRMGEIRNMADPFDIVKCVYLLAVGMDIRWTQMNGNFDFKKESFDAMCTLFQPTREITNY
ncbi:MAG: TetR/AcrR family transcriptional regulator [Clostridia bacterium]|nr:TetR/AcrR family transcriptional regulator [Clostridia bacterium]